MGERRFDVLVDKDWGSTGVWVPSASGGWANTSYAWLNLPQWLIDTFDYWSWWYEQCTPERIDEELDWEKWLAYELSLAIDLKRVLGDRARVFIRGRSEVQEILAAPYDPKWIP